MMPCVASYDIFKEAEVGFDLVLSNINADCSGILQLVSINTCHQCAPSALLLSAYGDNRLLRNVPELSQTQNSIIHCRCDEVN